MNSYLAIPLGILLVAGLLFAVVSIGGSSLVPQISGVSLEEETTPSDSDLIDNDAPYFDLPDLSGGRVRLSDFIDTPLVVVFWGTWSTEATDQLHIVDQYLSKRESELVTIITINSQEEKSIVSSFMRRGGYGVPTLLDVQGTTADEYGVKSLPTLYFVGRDGVIRDAHAGLMSERMLMDKVEKILK